MEGEIRAIREATEKLIRVSPLTLMFHENSATPVTIRLSNLRHRLQDCDLTTRYAAGTILKGANQGSPRLGVFLRYERTGRICNAC